jgi:hypothetical protein
MHLPDFDEPFDPGFDPLDLDLLDKKVWEKVPAPIRKIVEQHVAARLPAKIMAKLRDLHSGGKSISSDLAFFHFGGGMAVRNLCRERLDDRELRAYCGFGGDWDMCYIGSSQRSPRRRSEDRRRRSAVGNRGNSSSVSSSPNFSSTAAAPLALGQAYWPNKPPFGNAFSPLLGRNGASARLSSFSRKLGGL